MTSSPAPKGGDPRRDAFARYAVPEIDVLLRVAQTLVARPADAEDLVQDTLLRAFRAIDSFDGRPPRAWLLAIMRHAQVNRVRRRPELPGDRDGALGKLADGDDGAAGPEALAVDAAFDDAVADAVAALSDPFGPVVELVDINQLTYAEAATVLGVPVGTVMSRLHRARARIRDRLAAAGFGPRRGGR